MGVKIKRNRRIYLYLSINKYKLLLCLQNIVTICSFLWLAIQQLSFLFFELRCEHYSTIKCTGKSLFSIYFVIK